MKKLFTIILLAFAISFSYAQESKFYLAIGGAYATTGGDIEEPYENGFALNIGLGLRLNKTWGLTANLGSAGHAIDGTDSALGVAVLSVGPMMTFGNARVSWDFKPQYGFNMKGVWRGDDVAAGANFLGLGDVEDFEMSGTAIVLGNSIVFGTDKGFTFSIDLDYVMGEFDELSDSTDSIEIESKYKSWRLGAGVRINF